MATSTTYTPSAPSATTGQGSAVSNREDLTSILSVLAPEQTPLTALCPKSKATATFTEWTVDKLDDPNTDGTAEGADVTSFDDKFSGRARLGNYTQKFRRSYRVSDTQQAAKSVGPADIVEAQKKSIRELKRDVEASFCSDNDRSVENGAGTAYKLRGLGDWLDSAGPTDVPSDYRTPTGSILTAAPTENTFNNVIASIFTENGEVNSLTCIAGTALRKSIAEFTRTDNNASETVYQVTQMAASKEVTLAVNVFDSDFGVVKVVNGNPKCLPDANRGYLIQPGQLGCAVLTPLRVVQLEDQGGGPRGYCDTHLTLCVKHPKAHGKIDY
jgi:hypothetical protein